MKKLLFLLMISGFLFAQGEVSEKGGASKCELKGKDCLKCEGQKSFKCDTLKQSGKNKIGTAVLKKIIRSKVPVVILDARSGKYDDGRRIAGAKSLNDKSKPDEIGGLIPSRNTLIITYCSNIQCPASERLYKHLSKLGYNNVVEYPYGIEGWVKEGNEVELEAK